MPRGRPRKKPDTKPLVAGEEEIVEQEVVPVNEEERQQWEEWVHVWGPGYSTTEYMRLDELYRIMTAQLDAAGGIDEQQQDTARTCSRMALQRDKLIRSGDKDDITMAKQLDGMIRDNLKDSNMRKTDIPQEQQRLDGFVDRLQDVYGLGLDMTEDQVWDAFHKWCKKKKYPFTVDAAEHAIMMILNLIQKNDDLPEFAEKPKDMDFGEYEAEFEKEPNDAENEVYKYLGIVRGQYKPDDEEKDEGDAP